jgi:hypothetical protein
VETRRAYEVLHRTLIIGVGVAAAVAVLAVAAGAIITHDEVATLRAIAHQAKPVPLTIARAMLTNDPGLFSERHFSARGFLPSARGVARCAPTTAFLVVRTISPPSRALWWHIRTSIVTGVVTNTFAPDELLRVYAHQAYFGRVNGVNLYGIESASAAYFGKTARALTTAEAALLVSILPNPNALSPLRDPARAVQRRRRVLEQMAQHGYINEREFKVAVSQPLPARSGA